MTKAQKHTGRDAFGDFMDEFMNESDRACIILASAEIEVRLELLFEELFKSKSNKFRKDLFDFTGPLGSLSARIKMAYALNLITKDFYDLLELFRSIRNKIVHKGTEASLETPGIKEISEQILSHFSKSEKFIKWAFPVDGMSEKESQFRHALSFMILMVEMTTECLQPLGTKPQACDPEKHII